MFETQKSSRENTLQNKKSSSQINDQNWYIFYTAPRAEKVIYTELEQKNYEVFLPMTKTIRVWKNRQRKLIDQVLFPSYIFVNTYECELYNIRRVPKIATYIHCAGKPSIIPIEQIESIKKMLNLDEEVTVETKFYEGEKVRVIYGPLTGYEGILIKQKGKTKFGIQLKEINHTVMIDICTNALDKI